MCVECRSGTDRCKPRCDPPCFFRTPTLDRIKKWALQPHHRSFGATAGHCPHSGQARSCRVSARRPPGHLIAAFEQRCGAVVVHERPREFPGGFCVARESHARPCAGAWLFVFDGGDGRSRRSPSPSCGAPARERALAPNESACPYCAATLSAARRRAARAFTMAPVSESVPNGTVSPSPGRATGRSR